MSLVYEAAQKRDAAKGCVCMDHVVSGQLQTTPNHEGMRRFAERALERAREMRAAYLQQCTQV